MISAALIVHNEEKIIRTCLDSIKNVVEEIIVVHDGQCNDNTLKICKEYRAKTFIRQRIGEAEPHRLFSFQKAKGEWILQIDADESLSKELQQALRQLTQTRNVDAYAFRWEDPEEIRILGILPIKKYKPCLFRKNKISFSGLVHEQTKTSGKLIKSELLLNHKPRPMTNPAVFKRKTRHWAMAAAKILLERNLAKKPAIFYLIKAPVWGIIYLFIYLFIKGYILGGKNGLLMARYHATYNFLVNYYLFKLSSSS